MFISKCLFKIKFYNRDDITPDLNSIEGTYQEAAMKLGSKWHIYGHYERNE